MLGLGRKNADTGKKPPAGDFIFDVSTAEFEQKVLLASMDMPVLVDFWAPWCGPCKQLMPVLEAVVREAAGRVLLAKVNIDENPDLAQALRVQSVPTVFAFFKGQPVTAFAGVRPQSELKMMVDQLSRMAQQMKPDALDVPAVLRQAAEALAQGDLAKAQESYAAILSEEPGHVEAYTGLVRTFIAAGELDQARGLVDGAPEAIAKDPAFAAARTALELAASAPKPAEVQALAGRVDKNPEDHAARFELAVALFAAGRRAEAINALLEIIRRRRDWEEGKARLQLLKFFEAMGPADPLTMDGRRQLSSLLFS